MKLITDCFREAGYFTCNNPGPPKYNRRGKTDFNFDRKNPFDGIDWKERADGQPFYAQINIPDTHRVFKPDPQRPINPDDVELPDYYPEHPLIRKDWALYLESIQILDRKVGDILQRIDDEGLTDNTIVFFMSDHGRAHIRCKQFLYDGGIHIPLIVRYPGNKGIIEAGAVSNKLVSGVDFMPTSLKLAEIDVPNYVQGQTFLGEKATTRDAIFAARDRCDGTVDRIRCIRTQQYKLIRNYHPELPYMQFNGYKKLQYPLWSLINVLAEKGELNDAQEHFRLKSRPEEELYDLQNDPYEVNNLANDEKHATILNDLRTKLDTWIEETGDMGETPEPDDIIAYWKDNMRDSYNDRMEIRGLSPDISDADYVAWWEDQLL